MAQRGYCQCGFTNVPGSRFCAHCGGYVSADDGPLGRPIKWRAPSAGTIWLVILAVMIFIFISNSHQSDPDADAKQLRASQIFGDKLLAVAKDNQGVITRVEDYKYGPTLQVSDVWYEAPFRQKERLLESLTLAWLDSRRQAGLSDDSPGRVVLHDESGHELATWDSLWGTKIKR